MLLHLARFFQLLLTGLYTGLLFADRIGVSPIRPKLPAAAFVLYQQELHLRFGKLMPALLGGSLLAGLIALILQRRNYASKKFIFTVIATLCTIGVIILTRLINVPINETLMTWQVASPPENVMQLWAPWEATPFAPLSPYLVLQVSLTRRQVVNRPSSGCPVPTPDS